MFEQKNQHIFFSFTEETPLGSIWVAASDIGLVAVQIGGDEGTFTQRLASKYGDSVPSQNSRLAYIKAQIPAYLQGKQKTFNIDIHWDVMSEFQQRTLRAVYQIPYGETRTYGQIATEIGIPQAPRAVGRANATNPMPLVIPCHRLLGADGSLRGYGGGEGILTKAWLLELESQGK
jgi:O-6-methylguanine DNA methyltransferase